MATALMATLCRVEPRRRALLVAVAILALLVAGCSVVRGTVSTVRALDKAGFSSPGIRLGERDTFVIAVEKDTEDLPAAAVDAARVVWSRLPLPIERLEVTCGNGFGGKGTFAADRAELEQRFGVRDPELERGIQEGEVRTLGLVLLGLVAVGLAVAVGVVILVVVLVRRNRRLRPPVWPGPT